MKRVNTGRRRMLASLCGLVAAVAVERLHAQAAKPAVVELPRLDEKDNVAMSLGYVADAKKVNVAKNPSYKPTQTCANCPR